MRKIIPLFAILLFISCQHREQNVSNETDQTTYVDTLYSFFGEPIVLNDSILEQIAAIATKNDMISLQDSIIQIAEVKWRINMTGKGFVLFTSVQTDSPKMKSVVELLKEYYGEPYEGEIEDDGWMDLKWSSSNDSLDIFKPGCTLVRLRPVKSESGGMFLMFS